MKKVVEAYHIHWVSVNKYKQIWVNYGLRLSSNINHLPAENMQMVIVSPEM